MRRSRSSRIGTGLDIQGGGSDLIFPHHEFSAAHAECVTGERRFARHYVHAGMIGWDGHKMSKSRGNLVLVSRLRADGVEPAAIRLGLLAGHYRSDRSWSDAVLDEATARLQRWRAATPLPAGPDATDVVARVRRYLADDLDTPKALAALDGWSTDALEYGGHDTRGPADGGHRRRCAARRAALTGPPTYRSGVRFVAMGSVNGKVVLITGGASGIGAEVARRLHDKGAKLVLTDVDEALLKEIAHRLGEDRVLTAVADVRDLAAMQAAADQGIDRFGGIDIVMANAGIATYGSVLKVDPEAFKTLLDVNVVGVFNTVRAALPVGDRAARLRLDRLVRWRPTPRRPGSRRTTLAKAGVEHFANALRLEVAHLGRGRRVGAHVLDRHPAGPGSQGGIWRAFAEMIASLPGPLGKTTSVEKCGEAFVKGIEGRKRQINCPGWVRVFRWLRPLLATRLGERQLAERTFRSCGHRWTPRSAALGRSMSARTEALENR